MNSFKGWIYSLYLSGLGVLGEVESILIATGFLIFADSITGILCSIKRGKGLNSYDYGRTISKLTLYSLLVVCSLVIQKFLLISIPVVSLASGAIGTREGISIFENISFLTGLDLSSLIDKFRPNKSDKVE